MTIDGAVSITKPATDSHFRLIPCDCGSDNVAYVQQNDGRWRVRCFECGHTTTSHSTARHDVQMEWNHCSVRSQIRKGKFKC